MLTLKVFNKSRKIYECEWKNPIFETKRISLPTATKRKIVKITECKLYENNKFVCNWKFNAEVEVYPGDTIALDCIVKLINN